MLHLANHGTHHRGELAAMLALMDVPHPEDDLILYARQKQK
ncbi:MAG TPA: DinB family protein [Anaerolineales bacterium]|nr:DinB family protein [Anaerolineales bacterium]